MPKIHLITNVTIPSEKAVEIKTLLGKAIETIPGKSERWLMVQIEDNTTLYFQGSDAPCLMASVELLGSASDAIYDKMTAVLTEKMSLALSIDPARIYTQYAEFTHWGWNGRNF